MLYNWCEKAEDGETCKEGGLNGNAWGQVLGEEDYPTLSFGGVGGVKYKIPLVLNEGSIESGKNYIAYDPAHESILPTPTRNGFAFAGWYENAEFTGSAVRRIAAGETGAMTFYAKWLELPTLVNQGVIGECYEIANAEQLYSFAGLVNGNVSAPDCMPLGSNICGKLAADIYVNGSAAKTLMSMLNEDGTVKDGENVRT